MKAALVKFATEADLCAAFISALPNGWTAYPEWGGWDILLVSEHGWQIGVEAKLRLNAKVICQAAEAVSSWSATDPGPDYRAVLVPASGDLASICRILGITVITLHRHEPSVIYSNRDRAKLGWEIAPALPKPEHDEYGYWFDRCPWRRIELPDFVPDNAAGKPAPIRLTPWKIKAIKISILLDRRGWVARPDFKALGIDMSRWTQCRWLVPDAGRGRWVRGRQCPDFRREHPDNYAQIDAVAEKWLPPTPETQLSLGVAS